MKAKNKVGLTKGDRLFLERAAIKIQQIKLMLGVKTDAELGKLLGNISQQAISHARKKNKIPTTWIDKLIKQGVSVNDIFTDSTEHKKKHEPSQMREDEITIPGSPPEELEDVSSTHRIILDDETLAEFEDEIASKMIQLAAKKIDIKPNEFESEVLKIFTIQHVLPKSVEQMAEFFKKIHVIQLPKIPDTS